jgi:hypothetical protein
MIPAAQLVAMVVGGATGEPGWGRNGLAGMAVLLVGPQGDMRYRCLRRVIMHAVIRQYRGARGVVEEARGKLAHLEQTMRGTPGFGAYYFLETDDGVATITITEEETGTTESMRRAATWVQQNLESREQLGSPEVTTGQVLMSATR